MQYRRQEERTLGHADPTRELVRRTYRVNRRRVNGFGSTGAYNCVYTYRLTAFMKPFILVVIYLLVRDVALDQELPGDFDATATDSRFGMAREDVGNMLDVQDLQ
jgi:hypothetical protein